MPSRRLALHRPFQGHIVCPKPKVVCALSLKGIQGWGFSPLPPSFSLSGLPLPTSYLTDLLFFILFLFIVTLLYSLSVPPLSVNSPLCFSLSLCLPLSLCLFLSLCSLVLFAQTETLSAELKHYSSVFSVLDSPDWNIVCRVETSLTELKHYSFGSLVFSAELPWHLSLEVFVYFSENCIINTKTNSIYIFYCYLTFLSSY